MTRKWVWPIPHQLGVDEKSSTEDEHGYGTSGGHRCRDCSRDLEHQFGASGRSPAGALGRGSCAHHVDPFHNGGGLFAPPSRTWRWLTWVLVLSGLGTLDIAPSHETSDVAESWRPEEDTPSVSVSVSLERAAEDVTRRVHRAFAVPDRTHVDEFFQAAREAGGQVRCAPRYWPECRAYCAFVTDPDGTASRLFTKRPTDLARPPTRRKPNRIRNEVSA